MNGFTLDEYNNTISINKIFIYVMPILFILYHSLLIL